MENKYIAKTKPEMETIQEHTNRLIANLNVLKTIYPEIDIDWDILELACLYHDLGKMNLKFQKKIKGNPIKDEIPHSFLSTGFLDIKNLRKKYSDQQIKILATAIAYHHERNFRFSEFDDLVKSEIEVMKKEVEGFKYDKIPDCQVFKLPSGRYLDGNRVSERDGEDVFYQYILIKGLLNRIDYASSAHEKVEWKNDFLERAMDEMLQGWKKDKPKAAWNELQKYMIKNREENIIAIAQTGMGKTEAGLLWIGNNKGFFTLPLKTAINSIYDRIRGKIVTEKLEERVGLLHSDTFSEYIRRESDEDEASELEEVGLGKYYERTRQLSMPLTVCTIDQIFDFIYRYKGFEPKLATLAYSKVVIDEIQMYSSDLIAYLVSGLWHITQIGGKFSILTATFPPLIEDLLKKEGLKFKKPQPFINKDRNKIRHSIMVKNESINSDFIRSQYNKNKVLVICNTVKKAQELYDEIIANEEIKENLNLFHSNFIKKDRQDKESQILWMGDKDNKNQHGIWICTQVAEASLDIDFDILITELSDLNGLFQRMGRCYRGRPFNEDGYNCYVFDGGDDKCTGVGHVIDEEVFEFSKETLKNIDGKIGEEEKIKLINRIYTTEKLKKTKYYREIIKNLDYIKSLYTNEMDKDRAKKMFRNINSVTVIPKPIYEENRDLIYKYREEINEKIKKGISPMERENIRVKRAKARASLMDYTVSIPFYLVNNKNTEEFKINKYESIKIFKCNYGKEYGLTPIKNLVKEEEKKEWNNFF